jgi:hypothetical protein
MGQNRNSVKFPGCRWPTLQSDRPHGGRGYGKSQVQRYPKVPGRGFGEPCNPPWLKRRRTSVYNIGADIDSVRGDSSGMLDN